MTLTDEELAELDVAPVDQGWLTGRRFGWLLTIGGAIGLIASFILAVEKAKVLSDPNYAPSCTINPLITCGDALGSWQGSLLGFPNPYLGLVGFTVVIVLGVLLLTDLQLPQWVAWGLVAGTVAAFALISFLVYTSLYEIGKLCPYCMVVWAVVFVLIVYTPIYAWGLRQDISQRAPWIVRNRLLIVVGVFFVVLLLIFVRFARDLSILLSVG